MNAVLGSRWENEMIDPMHASHWEEEEAGDQQIPPKIKKSPLKTISLWLPQVRGAEPMTSNLLVLKTQTGVL